MRRGGAEIKAVAPAHAEALLAQLQPDGALQDIAELLALVRVVRLGAGAGTEPDDPHEGEEFGYVLQGAVWLQLGEQRFRVRRGDSFYFRPTAPHWLHNAGRTQARVLWVSTPPSF